MTYTTLIDRKKKLFYLGILGLLIPVLAVAEPPPKAKPSEQVEVAEVPLSELNLADWMTAFRSSDPLQRDAALRLSVAALAVEGSKNPQGIDLLLDAGVDGGLWAWTSGANAIGQVGLELDKASISGRDARGHRWEVSGTGRLALPGTTTLGGSSAAIGGAMYGSLAGNHQGRLYELETRYLALDKQAAENHEQDIIQRRCWFSADLYLRAWNVQEQLAVVEELLQTRKANRKQTEKDHRRGMVTRLDYLTAQSDVTRAERRKAVLTGRLHSAIASLSSFLEQRPDSLADPRPFLEKLLAEVDSAATRSLEAHPAVVAPGQLRQARIAESDWVGQRYKPSLELGPAIQFGTQSHQIDPTLQEAHGLNLSGGVAMRLTVPVSAPAQHYQQSILREHAELAHADKDEILRSLSERRGQALAQVNSAREGASLVQEQLTLIDAQVDAAWSRFVNGRLEYQDYLLHYTQYEEARLAALEMQLAELQARITLAELTAAPPEMCR